MTTPRPDADSRFPTMYCKTCGGGWLTFTRCNKDQWKGDDTGPHCDFTGEGKLINDPHEPNVPTAPNADCFATCWTKEDCRWTGCKKLKTQPRQIADDTIEQGLAAVPAEKILAQALLGGMPDSCLRACWTKDDCILNGCKKLQVSEQDCSGHVASAHDPKICGRCGVHIDSLRPDEQICFECGRGPSECRCVPAGYSEESVGKLDWSKLEPPK